MENKDIRWVQRFDNYNKALSQLEKAVEITFKRELTELEKQGLIQAFEYTHELAWKTLKDILNDSGNNEIYGSKDATREAFQYGLLTEGEIWMDMIKSRNNTSHTYNQDTADKIVDAILVDYHKEFKKLQERLIELQNKAK